MENIYPDMCILCCFYIAHIYQISCLVWKSTQKTSGVFFSTPFPKKQALVRLLRLIFQYSPSTNIELVAAKGSILVCSVNGNAYWIMQCAWYFNQKFYTHIE